MTHAFENTGLILTHLVKNNDLGAFSCVYVRKTNILKPFNSTFTFFSLFKEIQVKFSIL